MKKYLPEEFEDNKHEKVDKEYFQYIDTISGWNIEPREIIYNFPAFVGQVNIARQLFFYELYKKTINLAGDIAEIGTYKGASFLWWAKLIKLFEPYNATQVYGFDWFEGVGSGACAGQYVASYETLVDLIHLQKLEDVAILFKMNVVEEAKRFIKERPHLRFKLLFIDCGIKEVMEESLEAFYPRLVNGGVLIMDHYNLKVSPFESDIMEKYVGENKILQMPFNRHSSGYIIKARQ